MEYVLFVAAFIAALYFTARAIEWGIQYVIKESKRER